MRGLRNFGGVLQKFSGSLAANYKYIFGILSSSPVDWHPCWVLYLKGGVLVPGHRVAWNAPSRLRGCVQVNCQKLIPNLQFTYCIMHKLHDEVKKCFGKGFGWICALNRWSVQERAHISFCPVALRHYFLARKLCRQISDCILIRLTSIF